jgi:cytochrome P450
MADGSVALRQEAHDRAFSLPLEEIDVSKVELFTSDTFWPYFDRLRRDDPVHYCAKSDYGPYWSVTKFEDIVAVESNHQVFSSSSSKGGISILGGGESDDRTSFISLDPPAHDAQRKVVTPMFSSASINAMEPLIRERAGKILDELPVGEDFDFVDKVSIELTSQMLATLFDWPFEKRRLLPRASDLILLGMNHEDPAVTQARQVEIMDIFGHFVSLWNERYAAEPSNDLISMLAHGEPTRTLDPQFYFSNLVLLTVAGSDTTRHSISGAVMAFNQNPDQYKRLRENPELLESAVPEIIRYQSPVAHMRRTALEDAEVGGKRIKKGDAVIMWYPSANRDDTVIDDPYAFRIDRVRPRQHAAFGFGIHRCLGNRLAEMQLKIVWEEMLKRFSFIEIVGEPQRLKSNFVKGYDALPVKLHA